MRHRWMAAPMARTPPLTPVDRLRRTSRSSASTTLRSPVRSGSAPWLSRSCAARTSVSLLVRRLAGEHSAEQVLLRPSPVFRDSEIATPPLPRNVATIQEEITQP